MYHIRYGVIKYGDTDEQKTTLPPFSQSPYFVSAPSIRANRTQQAFETFKEVGWGKVITWLAHYAAC